MPSAQAKRNQATRGTRQLSPPAAVSVLLMALVSCERTPPAPPPVLARAPVVHDERVSATTRLLHREDGTTTAVISAGPRAYRDEEGRWADILPALEARQDGSLEARRNLVRAVFPERLGGEAAVRIEDRETGLGFSYWPALPSPTSAVRSDGAVARYELPGLEGSLEEFRVLRGTVKHNLVLGRPAAIDALLSRAGEGRLAARGRVRLDPGVRFAASGEALDVIGPSGRLFQLPPPSAFEVGHSENSSAAHYRFEPAGDEFSVEVDERWLRDERRVFPVAVDPPATAFTSYAAWVLGSTATGPGTLTGNDAPFLGRPFSSEYHQVAMKFDLGAIGPTPSVTAAKVNVYFDGLGSSGTTPVHFAPLTKDPELSDPASLFADGVHGVYADYAVTGSVTYNCACWINGGNPATQTGTDLGASGAADVQAALARGKFLLSMHLPSYSVNRFATVNGMLDANEPQLYVDYAGGAPTVPTCSRAATPSSSPSSMTSAARARPPSGWWWETRNAPNLRWCKSWPTPSTGRTPSP